MANSTTKKIRKSGFSSLKKSALFAFLLMIILAGEVLAISYLVLERDTKNEDTTQGSQNETSQEDGIKTLNLQEIEWYMRSTDIQVINAEEELKDASLYFKLPGEWVITPEEDGNETIYYVEDDNKNIQLQIEALDTYTDESGSQVLGNTGYGLVNDDVYSIVVDSTDYQVQYIRENTGLGQYTYKQVYLETGEEIGAETKTIGDYLIIKPVGVSEYKATFQIVLTLSDYDQTEVYLEVIDKIVNSMLVVIDEGAEEIISAEPIELEENTVNSETSYFGKITDEYCESFTLGLKITKEQDMSCRIYVQSLDKTGMLIVEYKGLKVIFSSLPVSDPDKKTWIDTPQYWTDEEQTSLYSSDTMFVNSYEESDGEGFVLNFGRINDVRLYPYGTDISEEEINISVTLTRNSSWYNDHEYDMNLTEDEKEDLTVILDAVEIIESIYN